MTRLFSHLDAGTVALLLIIAGGLVALMIVAAVRPRRDPPRVCCSPEIIERDTVARIRRRGGA